MSNILKEALQSKLQELQAEQVQRHTKLKDYQKRVFNDWKAQYIDKVPFISQKAKDTLVIEPGNGQIEFKCDSERWGSSITLNRDANWRSEEKRPELSWFSSRADKEDKNNYLSILQILGLLSSYMQSDLNAFNELLEVFDFYQKTSSEIMGNISHQIWEVESAIRNAEMNEREEEKIKMLNKGKFELPEDVDYLPSFYASADKWSNKRFSHMTWEENKGGKTYKVSGYVINKNWSDGKKCHTWFVDRMKKDRLLDAISEGIKKLKEYNEDKATVNA